MEVMIWSPWLRLFAKNKGHLSRSHSFRVRILKAWVPKGPGMPYSLRFRGLGFGGLGFRVQGFGGLGV